MILLGRWPLGVGKVLVGVVQGSRFKVQGSRFKVEGYSGMGVMVFGYLPIRKYKQ